MGLQVFQFLVFSFIYKQTYNEKKSSFWFHWLYYNTYGIETLKISYSQKYKLKLKNSNL